MESMKLFEIKTTSIFDDEIRTYYVLANDMVPALDKIKTWIPYQETVFTISQKELVQQKGRT